MSCVLGKIYYNQLFKWIKLKENGAAFLSFTHSPTIAPIKWKITLIGKHIQDNRTQKNAAGFSLDNTACCYGFLVFRYLLLLFIISGVFSGIYYCFASLGNFSVYQKIPNSAHTEV